MKKRSTHALGRRDVLRLALAGSALGALATRSLLRVVRAAPSLGSKKLLLIFLRGGNDALNTLVPTHDAEYFALRPTLAIDPNLAIDLGNGGAAFHPNLAKLAELQAAGALASIQRVGYPSPTLSHFSGQQFFETAKPGDDAFTEGWVTRLATVAGATDPLFAVSVSRDLQLAFNGERVLAHVPDIAKYALASSAANTKLLGSSASGLLQLFGAPPGPTPYDELVHSTGDMLGLSMHSLSSLPPWTPLAESFPKSFAELGAQGLPQQDFALEFLQALRDATRLLKHSNASIVGIEMPGFDHHSAQGSLNGPHADRLAVLAHGLRSVMRETLADIWNDLVVSVESEFGRTSAENGSGGTDHGEAGALFLAGGPVRGGVYHCDPQSWPAGATLLSSNARYVQHAVDFRTPRVEVLERHFGLDAGSIDVVVPGWSKLGGPTTQPLGLIR